MNKQPMIKEPMNKEDEVNARFLKRNVTGRALGSAAAGAFLGAQTGGMLGFSDKVPFETYSKYIKNGAAIGAGLLTANSIRKNIKYNRKVSELDEKLNKSAQYYCDIIEKMAANQMSYDLLNGTDTNGLNADYSEQHKTANEIVNEVFA